MSPYSPQKQQSGTCSQDKSATSCGTQAKPENKTETANKQPSLCLQENDDEVGMTVRQGR